MTTTAVYGVHFGDEGKGKIVDFLARDYDIVARWNGGDNAGHTVETRHSKIALHLVPSGILYKGKTNVIGNGVVINLASLKREIEWLISNGIAVSKDSLMISDMAHLILPYYSAIEEKKELTRKIGTTKKGIGVAYALKHDRSGIRLADIEDSDTFEERVKIHAGEYGLDIDAKSILSEQLSLLEWIRQHATIADTVKFFRENRTANILLEGAQGFFLDVDAGTYPFVTSSHASPAGAYSGCLGIKKIDNIIGVMKACYITRVGSGPFVTELGNIVDDKKESVELNEDDDDSVGKYIRVEGREYGTTTGRPRRTGWQDIVATKHSVDAANIGSSFSLALTKIDVLNGLKKIKACTEYRTGNKVMGHFPSSSRELVKCRPVYREFPWAPTDGVTEFEKLPPQTRDYLDFLETETGARIGIVSTGPRRDELIVR
ncbi:MAG: adenylosuccinate synthase [Candidatus Aenigmarchaeota archaeon]|nr:adenylosuccinate synthase [Candidatus Aenigmarchaeota archaeon]